jgi:hypothetical protein
MNVLSDQSLRIANVVAGTAVLVGLATSCAKDAAGLSEHPAVICTSEAGGPLVPKAQGTLTRTKSNNELIYRLDVQEQTYEWRFVTNPDKSTTIRGPGPLIGKLVEVPKAERALPFPRGPINALDTSPYVGPPGQSLHVNGEIREYLGPLRLWVVSGTKCPSR